MTWFFNNDGIADGPHEEPAMAELVQKGRVLPQTLVWHDGLTLWQEASVLQAAWWKVKLKAPQPQPALEVPAPAAAPKVATPRRNPKPLAPTPTEEVPKAKPGLFKRLFGRKSDS